MKIIFIKIKQILFLTLAIGAPYVNAQSPGSLDTTFDPGLIIVTPSNNPGVHAIATQPDGKILIGTNFSKQNGVGPNGGITRLNADGAIDFNFNIFGKGSDGIIVSIALQNDGKILIGGPFSRYNDIPVSGFTRLNADGSLDTGFNMGTGLNAPVQVIAVQSDGRIIVGGQFTTYNGVSRNRIARLHPNGTLDTTFNPGFGADDIIGSVTIQPDGKIIIGGSFTSYNGVNANLIARLNTDGTLDNTFNSGTGVGPVSSTAEVFQTAVQSDGKILIGGRFNSYNGVARQGIARLNANGSLDTNFEFSAPTGAGIAHTFGQIFALGVQADGKIIIGGAGTIERRLARLDANGTLDASFNSFSMDNSILAIALQGDTRLVIGGFFTTYNGTPRRHIARILTTTPCAVAATVTVSNNGLTLTANEANASYQWFECTAGIPIANATNQSFTATATGSYFVRITRGSCVADSHCTIVVVPEEDPNPDPGTELMAYPNPANGQFTLKNVKPGSTIRIVDAASGDVVETVSTSSKTVTIKTTKFKKGIYYIFQADASGSKTEKLKLMIE